MKVIRSGILGFCMGVRRAVEMALRESQTHTQTAVYTLGPLIHNPEVLKELEGRGIRILEEECGRFFPAPCTSPCMEAEQEAESGSGCSLENSTVIIRAHGVSPLVERELKQQGAVILDATCPFVKESQKKARDFAEKGYRVFLAGEAKHGEIAGIRGYADSSCFVVGNPAEAEAAAAELFKREPGAKTALIGQTTIRAEEYDAIGERIRAFFPKLEIEKTICNATLDRQEALRELCKKTDAIIIAGSRDSANTRRLLSLAKELGKPGWLVEKTADIPPEISAYETAGLCAGASTPDKLIDEIEAALKAL